MNNQFDTIPFQALDGFSCNLKHYVTKNPTPKGPVLLVHGAGVRSNIFNPPAEQNIIHMLSDAGYDVWLENWRASIDLEPNEWDLDQVAHFDHPAAVQKVLECTGHSELKAIVHCQGSTSFMISAALGLLPQVKVIISNAVSLHPVIPRFSVFKLSVLLPIVGTMFDYLDPSWGLGAPDFKSKMIKKLVKATHWEADTTVGKMVSFTYGSGMPALWELENLDKKTMDWIQYEFAHVPLTFFRHIRSCVREGVLKPSDGSGMEYQVTPPQTEARIVLFAGEKNKCFLAESQKRTFEYLDKLNPGFHQLYLLDEYSHLDVFFGKNAHIDVFPKMIAELDKN
ncbi:MAG: esterase [Lunatimonas sp.]|uniref:esterase n=1 Tax=Lunatimonas sp. TaxID=2060141 RepID=UPI00263A41A9|nr:esterase [Lunatimonas sp.]MCC5938178.1 esterase [Lunatimonas sp.]